MCPVQVADNVGEETSAAITSKPGGLHPPRQQRAPPLALLARADVPAIPPA